MKCFNKKELLLLANKLIKNIRDLCNTKEHYRSFVIKKNSKLVRQSEIITYQQKFFGIVDTKSIITKHLKTSHKLSKTIK